MRIAIAGVPNPIIWAIRRDDPAQVAIDHPAGWSVLNPTTNVPDLFQPCYSTHYYFLLNDTTLYLDNFQVAFSIPDSVTGEEVGDAAESLLRRLRFVTKQVALPTRLNLTSHRDVEALPPTDFPGADRVHAGGRPDRIRDSFYDTPVTMEAVRQAGTLPPDFTAPIYDLLLMDAMAALARDDCRTAILYAAIAVEALSGTLCEEEHQRLVNAAPRSETVRWITIVLPGGEASTIDPIYRHLTNSNSFSVLLSELPLYVFRRSMVEENQALYQRALRLYRTRNNLAHRGQTAAGADVFPITRAGAITAIECAVEVFGWFRASGAYFIPRGEWRRV